MEIIVNKISNPNLNIKSYQMRIEFREIFYESDYEKLLINDLDSEWKQIGVYYLWHIGDNFAEGFFDDFDDMKITLNEIIEITKNVLEKYNDEVLSITFKDIN